MTRLAICGLLAALVGASGPAQAQGTFQTLDPSYGGESARRAFYGGFALSGEAAYRDADLIGFAGTGALTDLALSARLDYALLPQVDLSLVADVSGAARNGGTGLSWVAVKPYWRGDGVDYAVRVAVDPVSEGGLGFRQTDVTFLSTSALSPTVTSDVSIGVRRLRTGYDEAGPTAVVEPTTDLAFVGAPPLAADDGGPVRSRLVGQSVRGSWGYSALFDPAGSRVSFGVLAEVGSYTVVQTRGDGDAEVARPVVGGASDRVQSGVGWARAGLEFSRPAYQLAPFVSVPLVTWANVQGEPVRHGPRLEKFRVGLRVTLR